MASCLLASIFSCAGSRRRLDDGFIFFGLLWPWRTQCCPRHQLQLIESLLDSRVATSGHPFSRWRSLVLEKGKDSGSEEMVEIFLFITILFLSWDKNGSGMDHCLPQRLPTICLSSLSTNLGKCSLTNYPTTHPIAPHPEHLPHRIFSKSLCSSMRGLFHFISPLDQCFPNLTRHHDFTLNASLSYHYLLYSVP